jgi:hypothetical protein
MKLYSDNKGFSTLIAMVLIISIGLVVASGIALIVLNNLKIARDYTLSKQSYYTAEAGVEDVLVRLKNNLPYSPTYSLDINGGTASISVETDPLFPSQRHIISEGDVNERIRKLDTKVSTNTQGISFAYAIHAGEGGFELKNNATVVGTVYSNQNIDGQNKLSSSITGEVWAVGTISDVTVVEDAHADTINNSIINQDAYYVNGNISGTTVDGTEHPNSPAVPIVDLFDIDYDFWRGESQSGGIISNDYTINSDIGFGPKKVEGNLFIDNNVTVTLDGPLWVTGNLTFGNNSLMKLASSYGENSTVLIVDGTIDVSNNSNILGSGTEGSYVMAISTSSSMDESNPAINVSNNVDGAVFFSPNGLSRIRNNVQIKEVSGKKILIDNNAQIIYETGLADAKFTSGPSGGWGLNDWRETE